MMKIFKKFLVASFLVLSLGAVSNVTVAAETQSGMARLAPSVMLHVLHLKSATRTMNQ